MLSKISLITKRIFLHLFPRQQFVFTLKINKPLKAPLMTSDSYMVHCLAANYLPTPQHMSLMSKHSSPPWTKEFFLKCHLNVYFSQIKKVRYGDGDVGATFNWSCDKAPDQIISIILDNFKRVKIYLSEKNFETKEKLWAWLVACLARLYFRRVSGLRCMEATRA